MWGPAVIRVGIAGCGRIVFTGHAPALAALPGVKVVAVADPSPAQRHVVGERLGVPRRRRHPTVTSLLAAGGVDVLDVAVPHAHHREVILAALAAGVPVVSEKPLGATLADIDVMAVAAAQAGVGLAVCHNRLFDPPFAGAVAAVRSGRVGQVFAVRLESLATGWWAGAGHDPAWRTRAAVAGGGCLLDNGYHSVYLAEALVGSPIVEVYARTLTAVHPIDVDDTAFVLATHATGAVSSLQLAWSAAGGTTAVHEACGGTGTVVVGRDGTPLAIFERATGTWSHPPLPASDGWGFTGLFAATLPALAAGEPVPAGMAEGRHVVAVIDACYRSSATGRAVAVPDVLIRAA